MLGVIITVIFALLIIGYVSSTQLTERVKQILYLAVGLRFVGAYFRAEMAADALEYFYWGERYAEYFTQLDFSPLYNTNLMRSEAWIGTNFVGYPVGVIISFLGSSWLGTFFAFGLLSFFGLLAFALAFRRCYPSHFSTYWAWIFLIPSLWFWPSSIGKESLMLTGLGVATFGFVGRSHRINWPVTALGVALVFCIRPQVAAVLLFAMIVSYLINFSEWNSKTMAQTILVLGIGLLGIWQSMNLTLGGDVRLETVEEYLAEGQRRSAKGGSEIESLDTSSTGVFSAMVNVLFRPFIWEAHTAQVLLAAMEVVLIWGLIFYRRRELVAALKMWRRDRVLRFAISFSFIYVVAFGLIVANLGIIARQRVLVFPFLFLIVEAGANYLRASQLRQRPVRRPLRRTAYQTF